VKGTESLVEITERRVFMPQLKKVEDYAQLLNDLKARIQAARTRAALSVNRELIALYWDMGKMIVERQQQHGWGDAVIDRLSQDLRREFPDNKGFSRRNLYLMRKFYLPIRTRRNLCSNLLHKFHGGTM
jgi:predicted nuclease of restriction endonuclease-like (RecB) superfamily